jgi:hypothetical protein
MTTVGGYLQTLALANFWSTDEGSCPGPLVSSCPASILLGCGEMISLAARLGVGQMNFSAKTGVGYLAAQRQETSVHPARSMAWYLGFADIARGAQQSLATVLRGASCHHCMPVASH